MKKLFKLITPGLSITYGHEQQQCTLQARKRIRETPASGLSSAFCPAFSQNLRMAITPDGAFLGLPAPSASASAGAFALLLLFSFAALLARFCSVLASCGHFKSFSITRSHNPAFPHHSASSQDVAQSTLQAALEFMATRCTLSVSQIHYVRFELQVARMYTDLFGGAAPPAAGRPTLPRPSPLCSLLRSAPSAALRNACGCCSRFGRRRVSHLLCQGLFCFAACVQLQLCERLLSLLHKPVITCAKLTASISSAIPYLELHILCDLGWFCRVQHITPAARRVQHGSI